MTQSAASVERPLAGVRVLDLTRVLAGPFCTMILADLGADVVKVERPETGDDARHIGPFLPSGASAYFGSVNRGKRSIVLDLKSDGDLDKFRRLATRADVLVENFRPGTMQTLGLGPEDLKPLNPRLIYASVSGFGRVGSHGRRAAYDIIIQAMSGLMSITGVDAAQPVRVGTSISDILSGLFTAIGIVAALDRRRQVDQGCELDVAMLDCSVAVLENALARFDVTGEVPQPLGTRHPSITPFQAFHTADGAIVVAAGNDALWRKLCEILELEHLATDPRLVANADRGRNHALLEASLAERFVTQSSAHWLSVLEASGIPAAPIRDVSQVRADPHLAERGMLHAIEDADGTRFVTAGCPLRFDGQSPQLSSRVPRLGEHTAAVLRDWLEP